MRGPYVDKNGFKKGAWSEEEDNKLRAYILRYGHWNWRLLPQFAGLARCGKSCRLRWLNYLKPGVRRGNYTKEEEDIVAKLHDEFGNKWSVIAAKLPGRTDNDIKNYWHTNLKKRTMRNINIAENSMHKSSCKSQDSSSEALKRLAKSKNDFDQPLDVHILESSGSNSENNPGRVNCDSEDSASSLRLLSEETVLAETYSRRVLELFQDNSSDSSFAGFGESFWSEPFMVDSSTCYSQDHSFSVPLDEGDDGIFSGYLFT